MLTAIVLGLLIALVLLTDWIDETPRSKAGRLKVIWWVLVALLIPSILLWIARINPFTGGF